jgi:hypothetical protein
VKLDLVDRAWLAASESCGLLQYLLGR